MQTTISSIHVSEKTFFERFDLVSGLGPFESRVKCPYAPTPLPFVQQLSLDFCTFFSPNGPSISLHHDSLSNLAESWYPHHGRVFY